MVVLPYKDSLVLFSKYLQQLVMESLGKELDLDGKVVNQGLAVYGNKGSTDQHAYVQQLRDGVNNFFATFIEVRKGRDGASIEVEPGTTSGDYLQGFLRGTRKALHENGRESLTISIPEVTPFQLGLLIALFERAVSLLRLAGQHQRLPPAGRRGRQEGRRGFPRTAQHRARPAHRRSQDRRRKSPPQSAPIPRTSITASPTSPPTARPTSSIGITRRKTTFSTSNRTGDHPLDHGVKGYNGYGQWLAGKIRRQARSSR